MSSAAKSKPPEALQSEAAQNELKQGDGADVKGAEADGKPAQPKQAVTQRDAQPTKPSRKQTESPIPGETGSAAIAKAPQPKATASAAAKAPEPESAETKKTDTLKKDAEPNTKTKGNATRAEKKPADSEGKVANANAVSEKDALKTAPKKADMPKAQPKSVAQANARAEAQSKPKLVAIPVTPAEAEPATRPSKPSPAEPMPAGPATEPGKVEPSETAVPEVASAYAMGAGKQVAAKLRQTRAKRLALRLLVFVLIPTAVSAVYYGAVASDQYESYSIIKVHSADTQPTMALEGLLGGMPGGASSQDALAVREYVLSRDMLSKLNKDHQFVAHYQQAHVDWASRLSDDASFEDAYDYYESKVHANFDTTAGTLTLRVRAFSPNMAQEFTQAILEYSEERVNELTDRERADRTGYAEKEVARAEKRLAKARQDLLELQRTHAEFNPEQTATAALTIRTQLEGQLAAARAELMELQSFMRPTAPKVRATQERVRSLSAQIAQKSLSLVNPKKSGGLSGSMVEFEAAMVEKEFAQGAYEAAWRALEMARADAARQHRYVARIARPSLPDESTYPRRWLGVLAVFVLSFLLLGILLLLGASIREHAKL